MPNQGEPIFEAREAQRRIDEAARASHLELRRLAEPGIPGLVVADLNGRVLEANDAFLAMLGYSRAELEAGKIGWDELNLPETRPLDERALEQIKALGAAMPYEKEMVHRDGRTVPVLLCPAALAGAPGEVICLILDTTELKRAKAARDRLESELTRRVAERTAELEDAKRRLREESGARMRAEADRQQLVGQLDESLAMLDALWKSAPIGLGYVDRDLRYVRINDKLASIHGMPVEAHIGRGVSEVSPSVDPHIVDRIRGVLETGQPVLDAELSGEKPANRGQHGWWLVSYYPVKLGGRTLGVGVLLKDITERKRAEQELSSSRLRLDIALAAARCGWFDWDLRTGVIVASKELEALYGLPPGGFGGTYAAWRELVHPEDLSEVEAPLSRALVTGDYFQDFRVVWPDGTIRWLLARSRIIRDPAGQPLRMVGVNVDITDLKQAEGALRANEARLRLLLERAPAILWTTDTHLRLTASMGAGLARGGLAPGEMMGAHVSEFLGVEDPGSAAIAAHLGALRGEEGGYEQEWRGRTLQVRVTPLSDHKRKTSGVVGMGVDITERVEAQHRIEALAAERGRLLAQSEEAVRARDVFLAVASHELRTPLTPLRISLQILQREHAKRPHDDRLSGRVEVAIRQVDRLSHLVENMLDIARGTMGWRVAIEPRAIDVAQLVRDVAARFTRDAARARSPLELCLVSPAMAWVDPAHIELVLGSLLSNAIKYGAGKPIEVSVERRPEVIRLAVRDHGAGVAPEERERIFGLFARAVSERRYGGLGLGLYIARQIVDASGGRITCSGEPGAGATFEVELPVGPPAQANAVSSAEPLDPGHQDV